MIQRHMKVDEQDHSRSARFTFWRTRSIRRLCIVLPGAQVWKFWSRARARSLSVNERQSAIWLVENFNLLPDWSRIGWAELLTWGDIQKAGAHLKTSQFLTNIYPWRHFQFQFLREINWVRTHYTRVFKFSHWSSPCLKTLSCQFWDLTKCPATRTTTTAAWKAPGLHLPTQIQVSNCCDFNERDFRFSHESSLTWDA